MHFVLCFFDWKDDMLLRKFSPSITHAQFYDDICTISHIRLNNTCACWMALFSKVVHILYLIKCPFDYPWLHLDTDGAYFGTTFPHLFLMTYGHLKPQSTSQSYVPRVFGFKIHKNWSRNLLWPPLGLGLQREHFPLSSPFGRNASTEQVDGSPQNSCAAFMYPGAFWDFQNS